jgi:hypothetical protein
MGVALGVAILVAVLSIRARNVHTFSVAYTILALISAVSAVFASRLCRGALPAKSLEPGSGKILNLIS